MFEVIYQVFNRKAQIVTKRKAFRTYAALVRYMDKVERKDNFWQIIGHDAGMLF